MSRRPRKAGTRITHFRHAGEVFAVVSVPLTPELPETLTPAEREVVSLLITGASNAQIAKARRVSVRTVANQVASVLKKLKASSRTALIARFGSTK
jgi:DNA-binding NarL/FixJ family response regulator